MQTQIVDFLRGNSHISVRAGILLFSPFPVGTLLNKSIAIFSEGENY